MHPLKVMVLTVVELGYTEDLETRMKQIKRAVKKFYGVPEIPAAYLTRVETLHLNCLTSFMHYCIIHANH
jgi:hypothetical protein